MNEELKFLEYISTRLGSAGIPYMLTGSMAMMFYAIPRMTRGIDLVVECRSQDIPKLLDLFSGECYISEETVKDAVYRQVQQLSGFEVSVVTPEDLILSKLVWARDSHSESQFRDVSMMLASVPELDFSYLEKWRPSWRFCPNSTN